MNSINLIGRLTKDVELRHTQTGVPVATFTIAVEDTYSQEKQAFFFNCVAWNQTAETLNKYVRKGDRVGVSGRLTQRAYENKDKVRITLHEVVAEKIDLLEPKKQETPVEDYAEQTDDDMPF